MFRTSDVVVIGILGAAAYWLYKKVGLPGAAAVDAGTSAIASFFPGTSPQASSAIGVTLPSGQVVPLLSMVPNIYVSPNGFQSSFQPDGTMQMSYGGNTYVITSQGGGVYSASLAGLGSVERFQRGIYR